MESEGIFMDPQTIYNDIQSLLQQQLSGVIYDAWFKEMKALEIIHTPDGHNTLVLSSPNSVAKRIVPERFAPIIQNCFEMLNYPNFSFTIIDEKAADTLGSQSEESKKSALEKAQLAANLNPKYTFSSFVEGNHNKMAYHSCLAVSDFPGTTYNPLFIWGDSGLGKTHLLHAIGNFVLENHEGKNVLYVPSETFMNEMVNSISTGTTENFREKYRKIDVLLIDDIQFLGKREATQNEFFHTFNTLYNNNKQIVICSDRPPENIEHLADRIRSRFKWGLTVDIQKPDYETRLAILKHKVDQDNLDIDMEVLSFIADHIDSNIRALEGALNNVKAYSRLFPNTRITIETASAALKDYTGNDIRKIISCQRIIETVCDYYKITVEDIRSRKKPQNIVYPRQIAMYLCRKLTTDSQDNIGDALGGRDHSTIIHGINRITEDLKSINNEELSRAISDIERRLTGE